MAIAKKLLTAGLIAGGALGALAAFNKMTASMAGELDTTLTGESRRYPWKYGDMFYQVQGAREARPLLLIHGFGPGASSYEWRKNVEALSQDFRVYPWLIGSFVTRPSQFAPLWCSRGGRY